MAKFKPARSSPRGGSTFCQSAVCQSASHPPPCPRSRSELPVPRLGGLRAPSATASRHGEAQFGQTVHQIPPCKSLMIPRSRPSPASSPSSSAQSATCLTLRAAVAELSSSEGVSQQPAASYSPSPLGRNEKEISQSHHHMFPTEHSKANRRLKVLHLGFSYMIYVFYLP